ncbi:hypothetical protein H1P_2810010 [Hyella patelloides LEGE 07179]|uniref:Uncharacterized protein n=1 Tax=Hyella patelloides LEGE 07179 TaxID=945734 RepID=A0A563VTL8_9CYAN|nr:hypothetical protein H1P_2810010 [Hyella patelloides LEGE 07179]
MTFTARVMLSQPTTFNKSHTLRDTHEDWTLLLIVAHLSIYQKHPSI